MRLKWDGIEWAFSKTHPECGGLYYVYWWNWLPKDARYIGIESMYYDGPHWTFGMWFTNVSWRLPCNQWDADKMWNWRWPCDWRTHRAGKEKA
jgi:hypothetical protein